MDGSREQGCCELRVTCLSHGHERLLIDAILHSADRRDRKLGRVSDADKSLISRHIADAAGLRFAQLLVGEIVQRKRAGSSGWRRGSA
jgi:hypothetical protein